MKKQELKSMYMLFDSIGNPVISSLRYHRKNSINTLEQREWDRLSKSGWQCKKVDVIISIPDK